MSPRAFLIGVMQLGLAAAVLLLSHYGYPIPGAVIVLLPVAWNWYRGGRNREALVKAVPSAVVGLSVVVLVGLSRQPASQAVFPVATQVALTLAYAAWLVWARPRPQTPVLVAVQQFAATTAIFLAAAFWHWPISVSVIAMWAATYCSALSYLKVTGEQAAAIMAAAWALVVAEISWVLFAWQVTYVIASGAIIIPQASLVLLGTGYCLGSIYRSHTERRLSRRRLIEYVAVGGVLLAIVIAGTRWSGAA